MVKYHKLLVSFRKLFKCWFIRCSLPCCRATPLNVETTGNASILHVFHLLPYTLRWKGTSFISSKKKFEWLLIWKNLYFLKWFGHDLMNIVYYCSLIRLISFCWTVYTPWCKEAFEDNRGRKKLETYVIWGVVLYSAQLPFFFLECFLEKRADEPESK